MKKKHGHIRIISKCSAMTTILSFCNLWDKIIKNLKLERNFILKDKYIKKDIAKIYRKT